MASLKSHPSSPSFHYSVVEHSSSVREWQPMSRQASPVDFACWGGVVRRINSPSANKASSRDGEREGAEEQCEEEGKY